MLLTKAAVMKAAGLFGLVCTTATTTYVAHKPISKAVERFHKPKAKKVAHKPAKALVAPPRAFIDCPRSEPILLGPNQPLEIQPFQIEPDLPAIQETNHIPHKTYWSSNIYPVTFVGHRPITPIPEPSTWAMMVIGFAGMALFARKKQNKKARQ